MQATALVPPEKFRSISFWLRETFQGEESPLFEINTDTIDILHELCCRNQERNEDYNRLSQLFKEEEESLRVEGNTLLAY